MSQTEPAGSVAARRAWFERLYTAAGQDGGDAVPWDRGGPHQLLADWADRQELTGSGRPAVVVGRGLGEDAEFLARLGFATVAFDFAQTAVEAARRRHPGSPVRYQVADLLDPPAAWREAFDLVIESLTVQSLPRSVRAEAVANVRCMVAPGGTLLVIAGAVDEADVDAEPADGPWRLTRRDVQSFAEGDLRLRTLEDLPGPAARRWRAEFGRRC